MAAVRKFAMSALPPMPSVSDLIRIYGLSARHQLSQNFILDANVTDRMIKPLGDLSNSTVLEVGPGPGLLTRSILKKAPKSLIVVEKDRRFVPSLEMLAGATNGVMNVVNGDILEFNYSSISNVVMEASLWDSYAQPALSIIGNLPFGISTPLMLQWVRHVKARTGPFQFGRTSLLLTFQKEVADRILAPVGHTDRSRLSVMTQNVFEVSLAMALPRTVFVPAPKVDATALLFVPRLRPLIDADLDTLEHIIKHAFSQSRKVLKNTLETLFIGDENIPELVTTLLQRAQVDPLLRPAQLSIEQFGALTHAYISLGRAPVLPFGAERDQRREERANDRLKERRDN